MKDLATHNEETGKVYLDGKDISKYCYLLTDTTKASNDTDLERSYVFVNGEEQERNTLSDKKFVYEDNKLLTITSNEDKVERECQYDVDGRLVQSLQYTKDNYIKPDISIFVDYYDNGDIKIYRYNDRRTIYDEQHRPTMISINDSYTCFIYTTRQNKQKVKRVKYFARVGEDAYQLMKEERYHYYKGNEFLNRIDEYSYDVGAYKDTVIKRTNIHFGKENKYLCTEVYEIIPIHHNRMFWDHANKRVSSWSWMNKKSKTIITGKRNYHIIEAVEYSDIPYSFAGYEGSLRITRSYDQDESILKQAYFMEVYKYICMEYIFYKDGSWDRRVNIDVSDMKEHPKKIKQLIGVYRSMETALNAVTNDIYKIAVMNSYMSIYNSNDNTGKVRNMILYTDTGYNIMYSEMENNEREYFYYDKGYAHRSADTGSYEYKVHEGRSRYTGKKVFMQNIPKDIIDIFMDKLVETWFGIKEGGNILWDIMGRTSLNTKR